MAATGRVYTQTDRLLTWPDGRVVRFALAVDITEVRQAEALTGWPAPEALGRLVEQADKNMYKEKIHRTTTAAHGVVKALLNALAEKDEVSSGHVSRVMAMAKQLS